jgi:hypothetical protein
MTPGSNTDEARTTRQPDIRRCVAVLAAIRRSLAVVAKGGQSRQHLRLTGCALAGGKSLRHCRTEEMIWPKIVLASTLAIRERYPMEAAISTLLVSALCS